MLEILLGLLTVVSIQTTTIKLSYTIQGEAQGCGIPGMVAIANVHEVNSVMYGWQEPSREARKIALLASKGKLPDITKKAEFVFSNGDLLKPKVKNIANGQKYRFSILCNGTRSLNFYGK
jgi:hypothetical protein